MRTRPIHFILGLLLLAAITIVELTPSNTSAQDDPFAGNKIVFQSNRNGNYDIMSINPDGTDLRLLTSDRGNDTDPSWSPDQSMIAYYATLTNGERRLMVMNADGGDQQMVSDLNIGVGVGKPEWSPDGARIVAGVGTDSAEQSLYLFSLDGTDPVQLTESGRKGRVSRAWSPDGTRFAYWNANDPPPDILDTRVYIVDIATGEISQPATLDIVHSSPDWSPVEDRIAFDLDGDIWTINADGTELTQLTSGPNVALIPKWSPDGTQILFRVSISEETRRQGVHGLGVMNADGSDIRIFLQPRADMLIFEWSPDGTQVVFEQGEPGSPRPQDIYVVNVATGDVINLTELSGYDDTNPDW